MLETALFTEPALIEWDEAALRAIHLQRLRRLVRLRRMHEHDLNSRGLRLLDHSIFSAYCDCRDVGVEAQARAILGDVLAAQTLDANAQLSFLDEARAS